MHIRKVPFPTKATVHSPQSTAHRSKEKAKTQTLMSAAVSKRHFIHTPNMYVKVFFSTTKTPQKQRKCKDMLIFAAVCKRHFIPAPDFVMEALSMKKGKCGNKYNIVVVQCRKRKRQHFIWQ